MSNRNFAVPISDELLAKLQNVLSLYPQESQQTLSDLIEPILEQWADQELAKATRIALSILEQRNSTAHLQKKPEANASEPKIKLERRPKQSKVSEPNHKKLTKPATPLVDPQDKHFLQHKWRLTENGWVRRIREKGKQKALYLHREILNVSGDQGSPVVFDNGNKADCRRRNLQVISMSELVKREY
jgi:hypothetical protein